MKLHTSTTLLHTSGVMERTQAHIKMSPAAFKILSSTVYSDKIGAVLREIGCNAADAHVEMGTPDRPFDVKMPSTLKTIFWPSAENCAVKSATHVHKIFP